MSLCMSNPWPIRSAGSADIDKPLNELSSSKGRERKEKKEHSEIVKERKCKHQTYSNIDLSRRRAIPTVSCVINEHIRLVEVKDLTEGSSTL
jgi:hypothetical protein